ncbi:MAG: hypothetical protein RAK22_01145 [Nanoarchaeota archaeon]|nr:hypothetical protein [Nanoarchaeota archaeon]
MNKKASISLTLMMIIIAIIGLFLILFYLIFFSPGTIEHLIPKMPEIPAV